MTSAIGDSTSFAPLPPSCCPVCRSRHPEHVLTSKGRDYWRCLTCATRFLNPVHHPSPEEELRQYRSHENDPGDPRYRAFLEKLATPLLAKLVPPERILDFGAGPGPALARMLEEAGHQVAVYDPFFADDKSVLNATYDAVVCTETAEHFHDPGHEFARFDTLLKSGGWLAVMTCFQTDDACFEHWHYRLDPTHVVFYRAETFQHIARHFGWSCEIPCKDVALMQRR